MTRQPKKEFVPLHQWIGSPDPAPKPSQPSPEQRRQRRKAAQRSRLSDEQKANLARIREELKNDTKNKRASLQRLFHNKQEIDPSEALPDEE